MAFDHERLRVYGRAVELAEAVETLTRSVSVSHAAVADQIRRAAGSAVLKIAEGASEFSRKEKMRFCRMARRSVAEVRASLDVLVAARAVARSGVQP